MRFRFAEVDHEKYGDSWYAVNINDPSSMDAGIVEEWEETTGYHMLGDDFHGALEKRSFKALRAMLWLAVLLDGDDVAWGDFRPQVHRIDWENVGEPEGEAVGPNRATRRATTRSKKASPSASSSTSTT